jgi:hypothetical protein
MLGEVVGDLTGKITGQRVLESEGPGPKVESTFKVTGKLVGVDINMMGTYTATTGADGTLHGRAQGVVMATDGGMASWTGEGVGWFTDKGICYRGAIFIQSSHPNFSRLNKVASVFEWDVDNSDNAKGKIWEWK